MTDSEASLAPTAERKLSPMEAFAQSFRNKQLHSSFEEIPQTETVKQNFICSLKGEGLAKQKGRLYLTENYIAFSASLFGKTTKHVMKWEDISSIEADIGEIIITAKGQELPFSSFLNYDEALEAVNAGWRASLSGPSTNGITFLHPKSKLVKDSGDSSDSDDDYTSSETTDEETDGEVTYEDLLHTVNSAKRSIGKELNEEKEREKEQHPEKKNEKQHREGNQELDEAEEDESSSSSSSSSSSDDDEVEKVAEEQVRRLNIEIENSKKAALEEKKAALQRLKKQKEDELEKKKHELAEKLKHKQVTATETEPVKEQQPPTTKPSEASGGNSEASADVWDEVEKVAEALAAKKAEEKKKEDEDKKHRKEEEEEEREKEERLAREQEERERKEKEEKQRKEEEEERRRLAAASTATPTTTPTPISVPTPTKTTTQKTKEEGGVLWLLVGGALVVTTVAVAALVYKIRNK